MGERYFRSDKFRSLSEYAQLEEVVSAFNSYRQAQSDLTAAHEMADDMIPKCVKWQMKRLPMLNSGWKA